jgi:hypothetical protein
MSEAQRITLTLKGRWHGSYGVACCPAHDDRNPSLKLADGRDGRLLARCFAGCTFAAIMNGLRSLGIVDFRITEPRTDSDELSRNRVGQRREAEGNYRRARAAWDEALPIRGTIVEAYLQKVRGITCALPDTLRFHPSCWHPSAKNLPAMVARVDGSDGFAVHRTYLRPDGSGKAGTLPVRAMLGPVAGGAVRLSSGHDALAVVEGIESALSLLCVPLCGNVAVWAALSTSGMARLRLPNRIGSLIVATDCDDSGAGEAAGRLLATRATALGWCVTIFPAPVGRDWNDVFQSMKGGKQ